MESIRTRYLIVVWLLGPYILPVDTLHRVLQMPNSWAWWDATYYYSFYVLWTALVGIAFVRRAPKWSSLIGATPSREAVHDGCTFAVFLWVSGVALGYLTFFPLSYLFPEFVSYWYLPYAPVVYFEEHSILWAPTLVNLVPLVVFAPVLEELVFRGILLRRFTAKYGILRAVVMSSVIFGVGHPDVFAATLFGIGMCVLYLRHGSLLLIIGVHAAWNTVYFLIELLLTGIEREEQHYSLEEFQGDWPWGLLFGFATAVWIAVLVIRPRRDRKWELSAA